MYMYMKNILSLLMCGLLLFGCSDKSDDSAQRNDLKKLCKQMNTNISLLQKIVDAVESQLSISQLEQISNGYIIHFYDGSTVTITNGLTSEEAPIIGVDKEGDYYLWMLQGDYLTDKNGNKLKAQSTSGITPQLKIENDRWLLSIDNGQTWTDIGQATDVDITNGSGSVNSIFKSITEDDDNVYFTVTSALVITISKSENLLNKTIHVETEGVLKNVLGDYDYANTGSLKITGVLNDADFVVINQMPKLKDLDIAEVNITELPSRAFYESTNVENLILPNTLTTIGYYEFSESKLQTVVIPASVETIKIQAFSYCKSLETVTFGKGSQLKTIGGSAFSGCRALNTVDMSNCAQVEKLESNAFMFNEKLQLFKIGTATPPTCGDYVFDGINPNAELQVPWGCDNFYKAADGWNKFTSIIGLL